MSLLAVPVAPGRRRILPTPVLVGLTALVCGVAVTVAVSARSGSATIANVTPTPSGPAPAFSLSRINGPGKVSLTSLDGRPVVLSFFASWCDGCRQELSTVAALARSMGSKVQVVGIDVNDDAGAARSLLAQHGISYPVGSDNGGSVADRYRLPGLPTTVYLDRNHQVVGQTIGPLSEPVGRGWFAALQRTSV